MKFNAIAAAAAVVLMAACSPVKPQTMLLYPEGQQSEKSIDGSIGPVVDNGLGAAAENGDRGWIANIGDEASMDLYIPRKTNGKMVVVCPGGGYAGVSATFEGKYVAQWLNERGIAACVVKYRMPNRHWEVPLTDVQNVFRFCRKHAAEWGVEKIGIIGFSAGGHLAASASNLFLDPVTRPDFSILIYPVITMDPKVTHMGTRKALLGEGPQQNRDFSDLEQIFSIDRQVSRITPPTYIALCEDDTVVAPENSIRYYRALIEANVPAELHIYPFGGHGWGFFPSKGDAGEDDRMSYCREEFDASLEGWLDRIR